MSEFLTYASIILGLVASVSGGIAWYSASVRKRYAAERDFKHLLRSFEQLTQAIAAQNDDLDEKVDRINRRLDMMATIQTEIKTYLLAKFSGETIGRGQ